MIDSVIYSGRLGNRMIQVITAGLLARELDLYLKPEEINLGMSLGGLVDMNDFHKIFYLNPDLQNGKQLNEPVIKLDGGIKNLELSTFPQGKYVEVDVCNSIDHSLQGDFFAKYFEEMKNILLFKENPIQREGVFVHCRIEDIGPPQTATFEYFDYCLSKINKPGVISTASPSSNIVKEISKKYGLEIICMPPAESIWIACGYSDLVLDAGSFSFLMGILGRASTKYMYWPPPQYIWTGNYPLKIKSFNMVTL